MTDPSPDRRSWADAAGARLDFASLPNGDAVLLKPRESFAIVGDAFLSQVARLLRKDGFVPIRAEAAHPALNDVPADLGGTDGFSAGYGEVTNARQLRQLFQRATGSFRPAEDRWPDGDTIVDPFRPTLRYPARSDQEFEVLRERHFNAVRATVRRAATLIVSLEGIEAIEATADGAVLPIALDDARIDPARHEAKRYTLTETIADLEATIADLRAINPSIRIVLMVSPRPIAATRGGDHVVVADALAKAVLRVAMAQAATVPGVSYFPAREIALAVSPTYAADGRTLSADAIRVIARAFASAGEGTTATPAAAPVVNAVAAVKLAPRVKRVAAEAAEGQERPRKHRVDREERKPGPGRETPAERPRRRDAEAPEAALAARAAARAARKAAKAAHAPNEGKLARQREKATEPDLSHLSAPERKAHKAHRKLSAEPDAKAKDSA